MELIFMRTICIMNHKGGVGKTTTAVNVAAGISRKGKKVLLIDLDPQGNVDLSLKVGAQFNLYDALTGAVPLEQCIIHLATNLDIITSKETLMKAEHFLATQPEQRMKLKELLSSLQGYDFIFVDCPPSLGVLNQNAMAFCKEAFVPTSTDFLGYDALTKMKAIVQTVNDNYGHDLKITKVIPTLYDKRSRICKDTLQDIHNDFPYMISTPIRMNSKLKEAPKKGRSIFKHAKNSNGAHDYGKLVDEILEMGSIRVVQEVIA